MEGADYGDEDITADLEHGSAVAAKVIGRNLGIVKAATMVVLDKKANENDVANTKTIIKEKILESLLNAADDIARDEGRRKGKSVVSISWGVRSIFVPPEFLDTMRKSSSQARRGAVLTLFCPQSLSLRSWMRSTPPSSHWRTTMLETAPSARR